MDLQLPKQKVASNNIHLQCPCTIVAIGANGSGKSRFGKRILALNSSNGVHIAALSGIYRSIKQGDKLTTEFNRLAQYVSEDYCSSVISWYQESALSNKERPVTLFDKIQQLWNYVFPYNGLIFKNGELYLSPQNTPTFSYPIYQMSDGEKVVFYFISSVLSAKEEAIFLIEEPEIHLHSSIKILLWNELEKIRKDCSFVYITHDLEFASSRPHATRLWIKDYDVEFCSFDYDIINNEEFLPEEVFLEILGSRKSVLFIEGTDSQSIDHKLYTAIFPDFIVKSLGGCQKVIETTKAFNEQRAFHLLEAKGIVDRDRRDSEEIAYLRKQQIYVPEVAEVENLLMLESVIKVVARRMLKNEDFVFEQVKNNVIDLFSKEIEVQVTLHAKHSIQKKLDCALNLKLHNKDELCLAVKQIQSSICISEILDSLFSEFYHYIETRDYNSILRVYNQKGMLPQSRVCALCGLNNKNSYLQLVLDILYEGKNDGFILSQSIKKALQMDIVKH